MGKQLRKGSASARVLQSLDSLPSTEPVADIEARAKAMSDRDVSVQIRMPASLRAALQSDAVARETSMNALVLMGLRKLGYAVPIEKLTDRRRKLS